MTPRTYSNIAVATTLAAGIAAGDLSVTVSDATGYPSAPFAIVVDPGSVTSEEVMLVTAKAGATFTVTRAYDGTTAKAHAASSTVIHAAIAADFTDRAWLSEPNTFLQPNLFKAGADANVALTARRNSSGATEDIVQIQDETGGVLASVSKSGGALAFDHSAIGRGAVIDGDHPQGYHWLPSLYVSDGTITDMQAQDDYAVRSVFGTFTTLAPVAAVEQDFFALDVEIKTEGAIDIGWIEAFYGFITHAGSGTVGNIAGLDYSILNSGGGFITDCAGMGAGIQTFNGGAITNALGGALFLLCFGSEMTNATVSRANVACDADAVFGTLRNFYAEQDGMNAGATIGTNIGLDIDPIVAGTNRYAIRTAGGAHQFGDYLDLAEISTPGAPNNTHGRVFARDNSGVTECCFRGNSGDTLVMALSGLTVPTYSPTNVTTDRAFDADATTLAEIADVLGTLIADLQARKVLN